MDRAPSADQPATQRNRLGLPPWLRLPAWVREFVFIAVLYTAYELTRGVGQGGLHIAMRNGRDILKWEHDWHLSPEHVLTHAILHLTVVAVVASYFYSTMHYLITPIVLIWMYRCHRADYGHARTVLAFSTIIGLIGFYFIPTAPPRLLPHGGVLDVLLHVQQYGWWGGEGSVPKGLGSLSNQFAAMPSMHVGWALWCGVLIFKFAPRAWLRWLGLAYPMLTSIVVIATGNHYLLDAVAGVVVIALGYVLAIGFEALVARLRHVSRPA